MPQPVITSPGTASATVGQPFNYQIVATENPTAYGAIGLPNSLTVNSQTGLISGIPTEATTLYLSIFANVPGDSGSKQLVVTIAAAPVGPEITSPPTAVSAQVGVYFAVPIVAVAFSFTATNLPPGLSLPDQSVLIRGYPTQAGTFTSTITATDSSGTRTRIVTFTVAPAAVVTPAPVNNLLTPVQTQPEKIAVVVTALDRLVAAPRRDAATHIEGLRKKVMSLAQAEGIPYTTTPAASQVQQQETSIAQIKAVLLKYRETPRNHASVAVHNIYTEVVALAQLLQL